MFDMFAHVLWHSHAYHMRTCCCNKLITTLVLSIVFGFYCSVVYIMHPISGGSVGFGFTNSCYSWCESPIFKYLLQEKVGLGSSSSDTGKGKSKISKNITHGYHLVKGKSHHPMEDYCFAQFKKVDENELGLFAIFDGHLSHDIPNYLRTHLFDNILNEVIHGILIASYLFYISYGQRPRIS